MKTRRPFLLPAPARGHNTGNLDVQAGTGWHVSELVRFARRGSVEPYRGEAEDSAGVLVCPQTKSGEPLRTAVSVEVLEAGKRLLERGSFSFEKYTLAIKGACMAAGIHTLWPSSPLSWARALRCSHVTPLRARRSPGIARRPI